MTLSTAIVVFVWENVSVDKRGLKKLLILIKNKPAIVHGHFCIVIYTLICTPVCGQPSLCVTKSNFFASGETNVVATH